MAVDTKLSIPTVVETRDNVLTYRADPRPVTVEVKFAISTNPKLVEREEKDRETKFVVEMRAELRRDVDTKSKRLFVETRLRRFAVDRNPEVW